MHSESKQYQNIRSLEQRKSYFRATQGEKKNRQTWAPWKLSEKHFSRKAERVAWLLLGSEPLFLRSGYDVPVNLPQNNCYSQFWQERVKFQGTTLYLWGPGPGQEEGSRAGRFSCPRASIQHPVWVLCQCPALAEGAGLDGQQPESGP